MHWRRRSCVAGLGDFARMEKVGKYCDHRTRVRRTSYALPSAARPTAPSLLNPKSERRRPPSFEVTSPLLV